MGTTVTDPHRATVRIHPANLRPGDVLCSEDARPYTMVTGYPCTVGTSVYATTRCGGGLVFPAGTSALILARTTTTNER